jgi:hypothetical protein
MSQTHGVLTGGRLHPLQYYWFDNDCSGVIFMPTERMEAATSLVGLGTEAPTQTLDPDDANLQARRKVSVVNTLHHRIRQESWFQC